jgi:putative MATE family efflux protein
MRAFFCGMPANMLYNYCASILRSAGDTTRPLIFLSVAGVVNVILNIVLVLGFAIPGALGVGVATAASQWISCILVVIFMCRTSGPCKLSLKKLRIDRKKFQKIVAIGLPAGIQSALFSVSNVIIQSAIHSLESATVVAANTAAANIDNFIYIGMNSFAASAMTFTGQHVGARKYKRLKKVVFWHILLVISSGVLMGGLAYIFGRPLIGLFSPGNTEIADYGMIRLGIIGISYFLCGIMDTLCSTLRGFGKSIMPMIVSLVGVCLSRIIWIFTVFYPFFPNDIAVLYASYPITWFLTSSVFLVFLIIELRKHKSEEIQLEIE